MRAAACLIVFLASVPARARPGVRSFREERVPIAWFPAVGERGPWPAVGATVDGWALDCTAVGEGGAQPITCHSIPLARELRASGSPLGRCYALHAIAAPARARLDYAHTGFNKTHALLFVQYHTHTTEDVRGRCTAQGRDACMSDAAYPVIGHRVVKQTEHLVVTWAPELAADPFAAVHGTGPWLAPDDRAWPAPPVTGPYDEAPLVAIVNGTAPAADRFAAAVDLVTARLGAHDASGAREAFARAAALAGDLGGTPFVAPSLARATAADADALASGATPVSARHAMLRAMIGAGVFTDPADLQHAQVVAGALRDQIRPSAAASHVFFRGEDPVLYVPGKLGALTRLLHERWVDPCPPASAPRRTRSTSVRRSLDQGAPAPASGQARGLDDVEAAASSTYAVPSK